MDTNILETMISQLKDRLEPKYHPLVDSLVSTAIKAGIEEGAKSKNNEKVLELFNRIIRENEGRGILKVHFQFDDAESSIGSFIEK